MNEIIEALFANFTVDKIAIPVEYMVYYGHGEPYVVYRQYDNDNSYSCDDELAGYVTFYDFDIYGKGNIKPIIEAVKAIMKGAGWTWQPSKDSPDLYETDTEYYHKTIVFAYPIQITDEEEENTLKEE